MILTRPCACNCGRLVTGNPNTRYLPACRRRLKAQRRLQLKSRQELKSLGKRPLVHGDGRPRPKICAVCSNLSERRDGVCPGCGLPWAPERRSA